MRLVMKRLIVNTFALMVILSGGFALSSSSNAMNTQIKAFDKCGECETSDKCCSVNSDGSCSTHECVEPDNN